MLIKITERVRDIFSKNDKALVTGTAVDYFIDGFEGDMSEKALKNFIGLDDFDFMHAIKVWGRHKDLVLSILCKNILNRNLLKIRLQAEPFSQDVVQQKIGEACHKLRITPEEAKYLVFSGETVNTMYKTNDEHIKILFKNGEVKDISQVDHALIHKTLSSPVKKFYICYYE